MTQPSLSFLGVTPQAEQLYRRLLRSGASHDNALPGGFLADAYRVLAPLGLIRQMPGGVLVPASPVRAVEILVERALGDRRDVLEAQVARAAIVDSLIAEQEQSFVISGQGASARQSIEHVEGLEAVRAVIDQLTYFTRTESLTTNPTGVMSADTIAHARPLDARVLRRGVRMRTLLGHAALIDRPTMTYARELAGKGALIRISHEPLDRLIICDRAAALTPIDPAHSARGAILTRESGLVAALVSFFERMWNAAHDLLDGAEEVREPADVITPFEREVLLSLCRTGKDESGARELGISVRTYRKHVAGLMQSLDATTRFQAALAARERGWI